MEVKRSNSAIDPTDSNWTSESSNHEEESPEPTTTPSQIQPSTENFTIAAKLELNDSARKGQGLGSKLRKRIKKNSKSDNKRQNLFQCEYCDKVFEKSVSLGGHISKAHAGLSKRFSDKMKVFARRKPDREHLQKAKVWFEKKTGLDPKAYRIVVTGIKKDLLAGRKPRLPTAFLNTTTSSGSN